MMKKNSERNAAIRFMKKLFILLSLYSPTGSLFPGRPFHGPEEL